MSDGKNKENTQDKSLKGILLAGLAELEEINLEAFKIISSSIQEGFFEERQTPKPLDDFADSVIDAITGGFEEHEDQ